MERRKTKLYCERLVEGDYQTCESEKCFKVATWYVEGFMYCDEHKEEVLKILQKIGKGEGK